jgi:C1A family cysteine protease
MPKKGEEFLGGHAVLCVGYDDHKHHFIMRNSWGDSWGDKGYFYLPYEYLLDHNLASDFWAILSVNEK